MFSRRTRVCCRASVGIPLLRRWMGVATREWAAKRFYEQADVYSTQDGQFGIQLDSRRLRTPQKKLFVVPYQGLAVAITHEWNSQGDMIQPSLMHLTGLCNTVLDNPHQFSREEATTQAQQCLLSDTLWTTQSTLSFRASEPEELVTLQRKHWEPVLSWFNDRYGGDLQATDTLAPLEPSQQLRQALSQYMLGLGCWGLAGFQYVLASCHSIIITCALYEERISPVVACRLARLETEFQASRWGSVEWQHGIEEQDLCSRLSASLLLHILTRSD